MDRHFWRRRWPALVALGAVVGAGLAFLLWTDAGANDPTPAPEPSEVVEVVAARPERHAPTASVVGTVVAARAVTVRNEVPGTIARMAIAPGALVNAGDLLLALDASLERAELVAYEAQARLAEARLARLDSLGASSAVSKMDIDTARAEKDMALAQVQRVQALVARKTLRAPFRARVGITDLQVGQYLAEGQTVTSLQGVDERPFVDFRVAQAAALRLAAESIVSIAARGQHTVAARVIATDALVDPASRSVLVRARLEDPTQVLKPGSAVTVSLPVGEPQHVVVVPRSAIRRGPDGDHVFVIRETAPGELRAHRRRISLETQGDSEALVMQGLEAGERVAAAGSFKLRDAMRVTESPP